MIGRNHIQDSPWPPLDAQGKFGAGTLYHRVVAWDYQLEPQYLRASNKDSEHFIGNLPVRIVVAQLAGQTASTDMPRRISNRAYLRPGNQSIGGT